MSTDIEITLISPRSELHYLPGIIWIPSGLRKREDLVIPLENFFRRKNVSFHGGTVTGLSDRGILVSPTGKNNFMLPASLLLHWTKRVSERLYLRQFRSASRGNNHDVCRREVR